MKVIFLVGLCGSGKSRKARQMAKEGYEWVEGFHGSPERFDAMVGHLKAGKNCVGEELQTVGVGYRHALAETLKELVPGVEVEFWFFEKNLRKAAINVLSRPDDKKVVEDHLAINGRIYDHYHIPEGAVVLPIEPPTPYEE